MDDPRLLLLFHIDNGLTLEADEVERILYAEGLSAAELAGLVTSAEARGYLEREKKWAEVARRALGPTRDAGVRWVLKGDRDYPRAWLSLSRAPIFFSYLGAPCWHELEMLAVVGSRTPRVDTCLWLQRELGRFLKENPYGIVSGGARGVDQFAHRLSLDYGRPTVAVLPTGIMNPYPHDQEQLWRRIVRSGGAIVSTFGPNEELRKWAFHVRNRWIAGLASVCFVAEANRRSGSLLTAGLALAEGREVCTLPVFPHETQGLANLDLMADGAVLLRDYRDLKTLCDRLASGPAALERANREKEENSVH